MTELTTMFNHIVDSETYGNFANPVSKIKRLPARSETHVSYTTDQFQKMFDYMKKHDPYLLFFIKIIAFSYLRIDEAKAIKIGEIDLQVRKITFKRKRK